MTIELVQASIVVTANLHNPSILHPSFLKSEGIVPPDWELAEQPPISTSAVSAVQFRNGIAFTVEPMKLQILDQRPPEDARGAVLPDLALRYVEALPKVRYTAVGINFTGFLEHAEPAKYLVDRFLRAGPWNAEPQPLRGIELKFVYESAERRLQLSVAPGGIQATQENARPRQGVVISGNHHREVKKSEDLTAAFANFSEVTTEFNRIATSILLSRVD
jgi:hypothetical protein